ncbi:MAG: hypothetical protein K2Y08_00110 [Alphaproteobacteria bacterium]|nr:hypothetical protein [Alphaproteobacteria bacterium]
MKNYTQFLLLIVGISTGFVDSSKAMDPKEDLWQDMIQIAESRGRYNQIVHNIYTDWQKEKITPELTEQVNNFTQQLTNIDYDSILNREGIFDSKTRNQFAKHMRIETLKKFPLNSLKNKIGWEFFEHSLRAFKTPQERMAICPRLVEELEFLRAENLGGLHSKIEQPTGFEQDELNHTIVLLERLRRYSEQAALCDDGFGMTKIAMGFTQRDLSKESIEKTVTSRTENKEKVNMGISPEKSQKLKDKSGLPTATVKIENALMPINLSKESAEKQIASWVENKKKVTMDVLPERSKKLEDNRGFSTVICNFVNKNMNPIRDQVYVDHVLEFLSNYVIQPDTDHLKTNFPRAENIKRPTVDLTEFLPLELMKSKKKKPTAPKKAAKKKPLSAKAFQKEKAVKVPTPSAQVLPSPLTPIKESTKAIPVVDKPEAISPEILPQPIALPQKNVVTPPEENHPLKEELRMAFTNAYELEGYLAIFESQSRRAHINFEDLAKGKDSSKDKKSNGLSWKNFKRFLQNKGWTVDEGLSKGSSVSFIPPRRFASLTGLTPKRINVHKPKDTKILLYEGYLKFFRSGFESMGLTEKSISDWRKALE